MLRFTLNIILLAVLVGWVAAQEGQVHISLGETEIEAAWSAVLALAVVVLVLWWVFAKIWFTVKFGWSRRKEQQFRKKQEKGLAALTQTFSALAANNLHAASKLQHRTAKLLGAEPIVTWLGAEIAARQGKDRQAESAYRALVQNADARVLGWRGLLKKNVSGDDVLKLTETALQDKSMARQAFVYDTRLQELVMRHSWRDALDALNKAIDSGVYHKARAKELEVGLSLMCALAEANTGNAADDLQKLYKVAPGFVPVTVAYIKHLRTTKDQEKINKIMRAAWSVSPHPDLLALFMDINAHESPVARLQRFEQFAGKRKDHIATHLALGRLALAADMLGKARDHAQDAQVQCRTREGYMLLADIMQAEQPASGMAGEYLRQAAETQPLGRWQCSACRSHFDAWHVQCHACGALACLQWREAAPTVPAVL